MAWKGFSSGEGLSDQDRLAVRTHLTRCGECREWVRARILASLPRLSAPPELDERLPTECGLASSSVLALQALTSYPAPAVLDRLVAEELEEPALHRTNRFTDLEKMRAPDQLELALEHSLQRSALVRRWIPVFGALAAASLLVWFTAGGYTPSGNHDAARPFEVVRPKTIQAFSPWIQANFGALAGSSPRSSRVDRILGEEIR